jgi:hypothetical protein
VASLSSLDDTSMIGKDPWFGCLGSDEFISFVMVLQ